LEEASSNQISWQRARTMGNHPDHQTTEANQWPHHFNMLGQLLLGFIFMIVVFFLYVVGLGCERARLDRSYKIDFDCSLPTTSPVPHIPR
jgi:hypothetical protein